MRRVRTHEPNHPACAFEIEDMAVIQELVICLCWPCLGEEAETFEVHVFDLLTEAWRSDITFDRGDSVPFQPLFSLRRHRLHVLSETLMAFVLSSEEISIQMCNDRQFKLAYIIDISEMWVNFDDCMNVDGIFFSENLERIYFYGDHLAHALIKEAVVEGSEHQVGYVRSLASLEEVERWRRADPSNQVIKIVQRDHIFYVLEVGALETGLITFNMHTKQVLVIGLLVGDERIRDIFPTKLYHPFNACWLPGKDRLVVMGVANPHHPSLEWTIIFDEKRKGVAAARWRANPAMHAMLFRAGIIESDPFVCLGDELLFLKNSTKTFYRVSLQELHGKDDVIRSEMQRLEKLAHRAVLSRLEPSCKPEMNGRVKQPADVARCIFAMCPRVEPPIAEADAMSDPALASLNIV